MTEINQHKGWTIFAVQDIFQDRDGLCSFLSPFISGRISQLWLEIKGAGDKQEILATKICETNAWQKRKRYSLCGFATLSHLGQFWWMATVSRFVSGWVLNTSAFKFPSRTKVNSIYFEPYTHTDVGIIRNCLQGFYNAINSHIKCFQEYYFRRCPVIRYPSWNKTKVVSISYT